MHELDAALARAMEAIAGRDLAGAADLLVAARALVPPDGAALTRARLEGTQAELAAADEDQVAAELGFALAYDLAVKAGGQSNASRWAGRLAGVLAERRRYREALAWHERAVAHARRSGVAHNVAASASQASATLRQAHRHVENARLLIEAAGTAAPAMPASTAADLLGQARTVLDMSGDLAGAEQINDRLDRLAEESWEAAGERERLMQDVAASRQRHARQLAEQERTPEGPAPAGAFAHYLAETMAFFEREGRAEGMADTGHLLADIALARAGSGADTWKDWVEPWLPQRIVTDAVIATARGAPARALHLSQRWKSLGFAWPNLLRQRAAASNPPDVAAYLRGLDDLAVNVGELRAAGPRQVQPRCEAVRAAGETALELGEALRRRDPALAARLGVPVWPEDLIELLPHSSPIAIVDLVVGHAASLALIVHGRDDRVDVVGAPAPDFAAEHALELLHVWDSGHLAHEVAERQGSALLRISRVLHDRLFCAIAHALARLRVTQVVLIPDLLVRHLPLHLAEVCEENVREVREAVRMNPPLEQAAMFCDVFPVEYAACLQAVAVSAPQKRPSSVGCVLSIADPGGDLPSTRDTARWLDERLPTGIETATRIGDDATLEALHRDLPGADIAVLGCHGCFRPDRPLESHLQLRDGPWTVASILEGGALERAPVLVLSACEVGGHAPTIDEIEASGLPGALISGGASAVLASMWPVEDVSMSYLVERFVEALAHPGFRPAAALFRAVHHLQRCTLAEAIERCSATMRRMEQDGTAETSPAQYRMLDGLRARLAEQGLPFPFASAQYWGGLVIVGSGWHQPVDGMVTHDPTALFEAMMERERAGELLHDGRAAEARPLLEHLMKAMQGAQRAAVLLQLAELAWRERATGCAQSARREALRWLARAKVVAHGIDEPGLAARMAGVEADLRTGADDA
ncbi:MAG TPA: CHAT domain-containing protein [Kofleriaceae bacterium]|nr:CHAT domain-containing protein [Kofleriaceae bacterium]